MFEIIENNGINNGLSIDLPENISVIYEELKTYCDPHGYPQELDINVWGYGGVNYIQPTKQNLNGIQYRFAVQAIMEKIPSSAEVVSILNAEHEKVITFVSDLRLKVSQQDEEKAAQQQQMETNNRAIYDAIGKGDMNLAESLEEGATNT